VRCSPAHREVELGRHDSDYVAVVPVDLNVTANYIWIFVESSDPQAVTQDHFVCVTGLVLVGENIPPQHRRNSECWEQAGRYAQAIQCFRWRRCVTRKIEKCIAINTCRFQRG
jgi:hypothetical protein